MRPFSILFVATCVLAVRADIPEDTTITLISPNYTEVNKGGSVSITCEFGNIGKDDMIIWKKSGDAPIFMEFDSAINDYRFNLNADEKPDANGKRTSELIINKIDLADDTTFYCGTLDTERFVGARVRVTVPPTAHVTPDVWPYTVLNKQQVTLKCTTGGNPTPKIYWSKEGGTMSSRVSIEGQYLRISSVDESDAGIYTCKANSSVGEAVSSTEMRVHDPHVVSGGPSQPWIRTAVKYMPVEMNGVVNISCEYDGNPHPNVEWLFNGAKLTLNKAMVRNSTIKQFAMRHANHSESILQINGASVDYFGDYSCRAVNNLGSVSTVVFVTAMPSPPELSLDGTTLTMTAQAPNGISQFDLFHRRPDENGWLNKIPVQVIKSDQTGDITWSKQIDLMEILPESGNYEIQVQAKNEYGSGNKANEMIRVTLPERSHLPTASASLFGFSSAVVAVLLFLQ